MNKESRIALKIMGMAVVLGSLAETLFLTRQWGIGVSIWAVAMLTAGTYLVKKEKIDIMGDGKLLVAPFIFFAAAFAWRDSNTLFGLNLLALMASMVLAAGTFRVGQLRIAGTFHYFISAFVSGLEAGFGTFLLIFTNVQWEEIRFGGWTKRLASIAIGLIIAVPIVIVFGALLASADTAYSSMLFGLFKGVSPDFLVHFLPICVASWLIAGLFRRAFLGNGPIPQVLQTPIDFRLGITELGITLGSLNLLFLSFVIVQFRYFFGGAARVVTSNGLTYADYARSGFFELVAVTALVLPLLLASHWLLRKGNRLHEHLYRGLSISLIGLLSVIMVSAFQRMRLYQSEYGMTELRLYVTAFMVWIAILFGWFAYTVLRGQRERFVFGALITGMIMVVMLNVMNPDAIIVRINVERARNGKQIDIDYIRSLSADSIPALIDALPDIDKKAQQQMADNVLDNWASRGNPGWRSWNWSRSRAMNLAAASQDGLQAMASRRK